MCNERCGEGLLFSPHACWCTANASYQMAAASMCPIRSGTIYFSTILDEIELNASIWIGSIAIQRNSVNGTTRRMQCDLLNKRFGLKFDRSDRQCPSSFSLNSHHFHLNFNKIKESRGFSLELEYYVFIACDIQANA